jgi:hypothetical protein
MLIFAHRGASADAPENTLLAIEKALAELKLLDAGQGQQIPTLWQVMQLDDGAVY